MKSLKIQANPANPATARVRHDCPSAANGIGMVFARRGKANLAKTIFQSVPWRPEFGWISHGSSGKHGLNLFHGQAGFVNFQLDNVWHSMSGNHGLPI